MPRSCHGLGRPSSVRFVDDVDTYHGAETYKILQIYYKMIQIPGSFVSVSTMSANVRYVCWDFHQLSWTWLAICSRATWNCSEWQRPSMPRGFATDLHSFMPLSRVCHSHGTSRDQRNTLCSQTHLNKFEHHVWWLDPHPNYKNRQK